MYQVSENAALVGVAPDVLLSCPAEIVMHIVGGHSDRLGSHDDPAATFPNTSPPKSGKKVLSNKEEKGDTRTPRALRGKPVCPLYSRLPVLRADDSGRAPVLAQNIARLDEVTVVT
jgi:hypothetical protein